jgi:hypothetical protein
MTSQDSDLLYSTTPAVSGSLIVLCRGSEIGTADDLEEAASIAAADAIAAWPEATPDFLHDVADEMNEDLANVVGKTEFKDNLTQYIGRRWTEAAPAPKPF